MKWQNALLYAVLSIPPIIMGCIAYVHYEHPAYIWDYGNYPHIFNRYAEMIARHDPHWTTYLLTSIRVDDYNPAAILPILPIYFLLGGGRTVYICAISVMYLLPAATLISVMAFQPRRIGVDPLPYWLVFILAVTFVPFWFPTLRGYPDIIGLISLSVATLILFKSDFLRQATIRSAIIIGWLLWTAFLFRRWYAFSVIGFFVAAFLAGIFVRWLDDRKVFWRSSLLLAIGLALSAIVGAGFVIAFQSTLVTRIMAASYAEFFSAYQVPLAIHLDMLVGRLTVFGVMAIFVGAMLALYRRDERLLFCLIAAVSTFVLFIRTQIVGLHHFLPIAMWAFPLLVAGLDRFWGWIPARAKGAAKVLAGLLPVAILAIDVAPTLPRGGAVADLFIPSPPAYPLHLLNYEEYQRLLADLNNDVGKDGAVAVYASSVALSDSLLEALSPELAPHVVDQLQSQVDSTANLDFSALRADYAVAASPPQTHLSIEFQRAITLPSDLLLKREGIGAAFEPIGGPYHLEGAEATIFRRTRLVTLTEMEDLLRRIAAYHPNWPSVYQKSLAIPFAAREITPQSDKGHGAVVNAATIALRPDKDLQSSVTVPLDPSVGAMPSRLNLRKDQTTGECAGADGADVTVLADDAPVWTGTVKSSDRVSVELPKAEKRVKLVIDKRVNSNGCDQVLAEFEIPRE